MLHLAAVILLHSCFISPTLMSAWTLSKSSHRPPPETHCHRRSVLRSLLITTPSLILPINSASAITTQQQEIDKRNLLSDINAYFTSLTTGNRKRPYANKQQVKKPPSATFAPAHPSRFKNIWDTNPPLIRYSSRFNNVTFEIVGTIPYKMMITNMFELSGERTVTMKLIRNQFDR
jgi:hypothetical protein